MAKNTLSKEQIDKLFETLKERFQQNKDRHKNILWEDFKSKLDKSNAKLWSVYKMEESGGEPDVIGKDKKTGEFIIFDCSKESPKGRRSICYDQEGQEEREKKGIYPKGNALGMAEAMGIKLLNEDQYKLLQTLGEFDTKTSSWIETPMDIRTLGGALFADYRYGEVFIYHNSAPSFYAARGFRGILKV